MALSADCGRSTKMEVDLSLIKMYVLPLLIPHILLDIAIYGMVPVFTCSVFLSSMLFMLLFIVCWSTVLGE